MDVFIAPVPEQVRAALIGCQAQRLATVKSWKMAKIERRMCFRAPVLNLHALTEGQQRSAVTGSGNLETKPLQDRRHEVDILAEGVDGRAARLV